MDNGIGCRVVRGPDWKWQNQDEGDGHVGTVVEIGKPGNSNTPDMTAVIQWDSGFRTNYRIGYQGAYDLRIYDNSPTGVRHSNIICDNCKQQGIMGMRWKCAKCFDFDLCHMCYMADKHDLTHPFIRFDTSNSSGVKVGKRSDSTVVRTKGVFTGARVTRGPDWDWGNQDGGEDMVGTVIDIRGWDNESGRSVANVTWTSGMTNVYRLGHKGKVDIKYEQAGEGGNYYKENLPVLGENVETSPASITHTLFKVGDRVKVDLEVDILKAMQEGHGGWNPRMAEYVGKSGSVHRITDKGDVRVQFEGCSNRWTFSAASLTKQQQYSVGDYIKISTDIQKVKDLQKGHGEWTDTMKEALGKTGRVLKVYADGDLRITVDGNTWTFNPICCVPISFGQQQQDSNNTMASSQHERQDHTKHVVDTPSSSVSSSADPDKQLVKEAAQGHLDIVQNIIAKNPDKINTKSSGKTALHVASHQGHVDVVKVLLAAGASIELQDDDGDTALHYSAFGNQPEVTEHLLEHDTNINKVNKAGCTALHVAVNKQHIHCTTILLKHKCDVNIQDSYGDTALHDAIGKDSRIIIDALINFPLTDFTLRNRRGFNPVHHAALKGHHYATEKILRKARQVVNSRKEDGFSALQLASLNGHIEVVNSLLTVGRADIELRNNRHQTSLILAVTQGHLDIMESLVLKGADVNAADEDGNTSLHLAVIRQTPIGTPSLNSQVAKIKADLNPAHIESYPGLAMACFLLHHQADPDFKNQANKSPLDFVLDQAVCDFLKRYHRPVQRGHSSTPKSAPAPPKRHSSATKSSSNSSSSSRSQQLKSRSAHHRSSLPTENHNVRTAASGDNHHRATTGDRHMNNKHPASSNSRKMETSPPECMVCDDELATVKFVPCGHQIVCPGCCVKMKKCLNCKTEITDKLGPDGKPLNLHVKDLQKRMQEIEDTVTCSICMERNINVAFLCGHSACTQCAKPLQTCHICRKAISKKINLFL